MTSVNGQTGDVVLAIPGSTSDLINDSGFVDAAGAAAAAPVQKVNGQTGTVTINKTSVGLGNVQNVLQYSASNPPPYPVTSVNTQTGDVVLSIPDSTSDLVNDVGFVDAAGAAAAAPVQSVNGMTGAVVVPAGVTGVNCFIGEELTTSFSIATAGFNSIAWSALGPARTLTGYTWVGWVLRCGTYRAVPIGVAGTDQLIYYVVSATNTQANFFAYPVFTKD